jgi:solute carrier family 25 protein 16
VSGRRIQREPAICPTDDDAIVPSKEHKKLDKRSWEYMAKSGIAGGLAGCAVSLPDIDYRTIY